jgi:hypothetical protein
VLNITHTALVPKYCTASVHWDVGHASVLAFCAALQAELWELGGRADSTLAAGSKGNLLSLVAQSNVTHSVDFFTSHPMMASFNRLAAAGALTAAETAATKAMVIKTFETETPESNNQHYQRAAGLLLAAETFPDAAKAPLWRQYAESVFSLVTAAGDITEDAPNCKCVRVWSGPHASLSCVHTART